MTKIYHYTKKRLLVCTFLFCCSLWVHAQNKFTGTIIDEQNNPLKGATVLVNGKSISTSSDAKGKFEITAPEGAILTVSYVGYLKKEIAATTTMLVILTAANTTLNDVVVVGYGTKKRKDITSSIATVSGDELRKAPVSSVAQALQGRAAGVQVVANEGQPGGSISIKIRGISTSSTSGNNEPLYVVDNIISPNGISFLNPSDIESIDILKDASATSIYGVAGGNGVIMIKTRKGSKKDKMSVFFDTYAGASKVYKRMNMMDARESSRTNTRLIRESNIFYKDDVGHVDFPVNPLWDTDAKIDSLDNPGNVWQDAVFRTGKLYDATITLNGGSEKTNYSISSGYRNEEGTIVNSNYKRYTVRMSADQQTREWLNLGINFNYATDKSAQSGNVNSDADGLVQSMLFSSPTIPVYSADGSFGDPPLPPPGYGARPVTQWYGDNFNPVSTLYARNPINNGYNYWGGAYAEIALPIKGLRFKTSIGVSRYNGSSKSFNRKRIGKISQPADVNSLGQSEYDSRNINFDNYLTYYKWTKGHSIEGTVGHSSTEGKNFSRNQAIRGFDSEAPQYQYVNFGIANTLIANENYSELATESYFARFTYNYDEKYYAQFSFRKDGVSNAFQDPNFVGRDPRKFGNFLAGSVKYRISKEKFFKKITFINDMSIRLSYGDAGTTGGNPYPGYTLLGIGTTALNNNNSFSQQTVYPSAYGNPLLGWERNRQKDIGLDLILLKNRLSITFDWYSRMTMNMVANAKINPIFGQATAPFINLPGDDMKNSGVELSATWSKNTGNFHYSFSGNISHNKNVLLNLGANPYLIPGNGSALSNGSIQVTRSTVGHSLGSFFGYNNIGIFQSQKEIDDSPKDEIYRQAVGCLKYEDVNNDGLIDQNDQVFIGEPQAKFTYSFNMQASYKNFDASILWQGVQGNKVYNWLYVQLTVGDPASSGDGTNHLKDINQWWSPENANGKYPRIIAGDPSGNRRNSNFWLQDGSYLRMKTVQIGYTLSASLIKKMQIQKLRFYLSANNLLTFTKYRGYDPEIGTNPNINYDNENRDLQTGVDRGKYPSPRAMLIGVNLIF